MNVENKKQIGILILAVGLGLAASVLVSRYIETQIDQERSKLLQEIENKKVKPMMREMAAMREEMKQLAARQVAVASQAGTGEGGTKGAPAIPKSSLALRTPAGKRAYTVLIDSLSAVGGLINPGDYVDVLAHMDVPDPVTSDKEKVSSMVFQNVQILAVGTNLQAPGGYEQQQSARALNITFALSPEEAGLMSFIERNGKMQLVLRAPAETDVEMMQVSSWASLADYVFEKQGTELLIPRAEAQLEAIGEGRKQEEIKPVIEIFRGGQEL